MTDLTYKVDRGQRGKPQVVYVGRLREEVVKKSSSQGETNQSSTRNIKADVISNEGFETDEMVLELEDNINGCKIISSGNLSLQQFFFCDRKKAKTKTSAEQLQKFLLRSFKRRCHSELKDHTTKCYETKHFCKTCDYSTEKKVNYIRHVRRNHSDEVRRVKAAFSLKI